MSVKQGDYPYKGFQGKCTFTTTKPLTKILSYQFCGDYGKKYECSTDKVYNFLKTGPLIVAIDASSRKFQLYKTGLYNEPCKKMTQGVILVGYGIEKGREFWRVRNSWGPKWGDSGYMMIARNESNNNSCFITSNAFGVDVQIKMKFLREIIYFYLFNK